jgi:hypothetical protein
MIKKLFILFLYLLSLISSSIIPLFIASQIKGRNYSDVGVRMYTNGDVAFLAGVVLYIVITAFIIIFFKNRVEKKGNLIYIIGIPIAILYFFIFLYFLAFGALW